jgi:peptidoglycan hydrolase-like protein with peptidoglycan-binding domain
MRWRGVIGSTAIAIAVIATPPPSPDAAETVDAGSGLEVTRALISEIQFMLLRLGMEPGPLDGIAGPQTIKAVNQFQERFGLPVGELVVGGRVSAPLLARLRSEASRVMFPAEKKPGAIPEPAAPLPAVSPPAQSAAQAPDRFAACPFAADDFRIGGSQYTPDDYLEAGFNGSTSRAVAMLKDRLTEARQIAANIGGSALTEVQRQSRVLDYFSCRLKIEQSSTR